MPKKVRPIPKGYHAVSPSLTQDDAAQTIEFCKKAFGAKLLMRMQAPSGKIMHAEVLIGDSIVMLNDVMQEPAQPANLFLYVRMSTKPSPGRSRLGRRSSCRRRTCSGATASVGSRTLGQPLGHRDTPRGRVAQGDEEARGGGILGWGMSGVVPAAARFST